ncbi:glycosyltransferase [Oryzihumus leptocrescens]|uniref:Glycosyl transferase family 1 n=1 Tax=Oryzihumus leptocrescens TaxID=297536 RepID=A0A542Z9B4_9MICO|nr:glycosyltransferase [Oryzihumus leptocrescens]TQL56924.1 glycosyl transferase family 1 [Oryzihumus leptocrescens]
MRNPLSSNPIHVRVESPASAQDLTANIVAALAMLADATRVELVGAGDPADVVHTIGSAQALCPGRALRVHSIERLPLRANGLSPAGWWVRSCSRMIPRVATWLVHGQTAGRLLVSSGVAPGERIRCLPLLGPAAAGPSTTTGETRADLRRALDVAPGVRLALGLEPGNSHVDAAAWAPTLHADRRRDLVVAQLRPVPGAPGHYAVRRLDGRQGAVAAPLPVVLRAADVLVATDSGLAASNPSAAAVDVGLPVVAVTTDSAAELVLSGGAGCVVPPRAEAVAQAVVAILEGGVTPRQFGPGPQDERRKVALLAHHLLDTYRQSLNVAMVRGLA